MLQRYAALMSSCSSGCTGSWAAQTPPSVPACLCSRFKNKRFNGRVLAPISMLMDSDWNFEGFAIGFRGRVFLSERVQSSSKFASDAIRIRSLLGESPATAASSTAIYCTPYPFVFKHDDPWNAICSRGEGQRQVPQQQMHMPFAVVSTASRSERLRGVNREHLFPFKPGFAAMCEFRGGLLMFATGDQPANTCPFSTLSSPSRLTSVNGHWDLPCRRRDPQNCHFLWAFADCCC